MTCKDLIMHDFVMMLTTGNYSQLSSDPEEGKNLFDQLNDEYTSLINSPGHAYICSILDELVSLKSRYVAVQAAVQVLITEYDKDVERLLRELGYQFDAENYRASIEKINRKLKTVRLNIERKLVEYDAALKKMKADKPTYEQFLKILATLSESVGFHLNIKTITVAEFAAYYDLHMTKIKRNATN